MTHPHMREHHAGHSAPTVFTDAEWQALRTADKEAGRNIAGLMTGVFASGLIGYAIIAWIASTG
jgi:hypothetical protein